MKTISTYILIISFSLLSFGISAQDKYQDKDPKAKELLDKVSAKHKALSSLEISFELSIKGKDVNEKITGNAFQKGDKYAYETKDYTVVCDGNSVWTYVKADNQVTITSVDDAEEDEQTINPTKILSIWKKGYKYKLIGTSTFNGKKVEEVKLFPDNPKKSKFHTISLYIDKTKNNIIGINIKGRDGVNTIYKIKSTKENSTIANSKFKFDSSKYPGIEEVDMRF